MASSADIQKFRDYFPEFSNSTTYSDLFVGNMIDLAQTYIDQTAFGTRYQLGWLYLSAHFVTIFYQSSMGSGGNSVNIGGVKSFKAENIHVDYGAVSVKDLNINDALLLQTSYGANFLMLRNSTIPSFTIYGNLL